MARQERKRPKVPGKTTPEVLRCADCRRPFTSRYAFKTHGCESARRAPESMGERT